MNKINCNNNNNYNACARVCVMYWLILLVLCKAIIDYETQIFYNLQLTRGNLCDVRIPNSCFVFNSSSIILYSIFVS